MPRRLINMLVLLLLLSAPAGATADGRVFAVADHRAAIPDQQAMIAWRDGTETLAIETRFEGTGTRFAWVVPLPAVPEISPATTGLFPTLRAIGTPHVRTEAGGLGMLLLFLTLLVAMLASAKGAGAKIVTGVLGVLLLLFILLPSLGRVRSLSAEGGVSVLDRRLVGSFETSVIRGGSADSLISWLTSNGFAVSAAAKPVIADYVARGWVFAAAKLTREGESGWSTPHPLVFNFASKQPVYPLKLTGFESDPVTVELCVFGEGTAGAPGFQVVRSFRPDYEEPQQQRPIRDDWVISHEAIRALAADLPVVTFLRARLSPRQMAEDAVVSIGPFRPQRQTVYTAQSAAWHALDVGMVLYIAAAVAIMVATVIRRGLFAPLRPLPYLFAAVGAGLIALPVRLMAPTAPATSRTRQWSETSRLEHMGWDIYADLADAGLPARDVTLPWLREHAARSIRATDEEGFTPHEEDSPGNYTFKRSSSGWEYHWYGPSGNEAFLLLTNQPD